MRLVTAILASLLLAAPAVAEQPEVTVETYAGSGTPADVTVLYQYDEQIPRDVEELYVTVYNLSDTYTDVPGLLVDNRVAVVHRLLAPTAVELDAMISAARSVGARSLAVVSPDPAMKPAACPYVCANCTWRDFSDALAEACRAHGGGANLSLSRDGKDGGSSEASGTCADGTKIRLFCCSWSRCG